MKLKIFIPLTSFLIGVGLGLLFGLNFRLNIGEDVQPLVGQTDNYVTTDVEMNAEVDVEFIKLNNQFIVPILTDGKLSSLVVVTLGLEIERNSSELIFSSEPKLRGALLQVLFDHANIGGFDNQFTESQNMKFLREILTNTAQNTIGGSIQKVYITDLARQDQ